jgi:hypothetical protein
MRTPQEIMKKVDRFLLSLSSQKDRSFAIKNVAFIITEEEAYEFQRYRKSQQTLHGDDGPYGLMALNVRLCHRGVYFTTSIAED